MQNLPSPEVYELEMKYTPWGVLIGEVTEYCVKRVKTNGCLLDLMCGPGFFLNKIKRERPDIECLGVDLENDFIHYGRGMYPNISFLHKDAREFDAGKKYDCVVCTAGVHHLPDCDQEVFIQKISELVAPGGFAIIGDPYIIDYYDPIGRQLALVELGEAFLRATIAMKAPMKVIDAAIQVLRNDVLEIEWKTSVKERRKMLEEYFKDVQTFKTWPKFPCMYGDYYFILSN